MHNLRLIINLQVIRLPIFLVSLEYDYQERYSLREKHSRLRKRAKFTQEQLAEKTGLSTIYIDYIEIGKKRPTLKTLTKIAAVLKVKVRELFLIDQKYLLFLVSFVWTLS